MVWTIHTRRKINQGHRSYTSRKNQSMTWTIHTAEKINQGNGPYTHAEKTINQGHEPYTHAEKKSIKDMDHTHTQKKNQSRTWTIHTRRKKINQVNNCFRKYIKGMFVLRRRFMVSRQQTDQTSSKPKYV